jgi:hypothetical protein
MDAVVITASKRAAAVQILSLLAIASASERHRSNVSAEIPISLDTTSTGEDSGGSKRATALCLNPLEYLAI